MNQRRPDTDRVLASIDAAVDNRCACGCGASLHPNGASMWFADQDCQRRFQLRQATNPNEVLLRPDRYPEVVDRHTVPPAPRHISLTELAAAEIAARRRSTDRFSFTRQPPDAPSGVDLYLLLQTAEMLHGITGMGVVTRLPPPSPTRPDPTPVIAIGPPEEGWLPASAGPLPWRRQCGSCQQYTEPQERQYIPDVHRIAALYDVSADMLSFSTLPPPTALRDACRHCHQPWPGPKMLPQWRYRADSYRHELRLAAADVWTVIGITGELVVDADRLQLRAHVWTELEHAVTDRLMWRDPCHVNGCHTIARAEFALIAIPGMPRRLKVCPRHEHDLMQSPAYRFQP